jgi:FMN-dependent NADH-azoreductase
MEKFGGFKAYINKVYKLYIKEERMCIYSYLKAVLAFIGITDVQSVIAEGMAAFPNEAEGIKEKAMKQAQEVAKNF